MEPCFKALRTHFLAWLDDFAVYAKHEQELLTVLRSFLTISRRYNLVISLSKRTLIVKRMKWCGRVLDKDWVLLDPANYSGIRNSSELQTAAEICQKFHCLGWMSNSIPLFSERGAPLHEMLERAYKLLGRRTKKSIERIQLKELNWGESEQRYFECLQQQLI